MLKNSSNQITLCFQVMFSLVSPSSLPKVARLDFLGEIPPKFERQLRWRE